MNRDFYSQNRRLLETSRRAGGSGRSVLAGQRPRRFLIELQEFQESERPTCRKFTAGRTTQFELGNAVGPVGHGASHQVDLADIAARAPSLMIHHKPSEPLDEKGWCCLPPWAAKQKPYDETCYAGCQG